jgi:hypothetical protein
LQLLTGRRGPFFTSRDPLSRHVNGLIWAPEEKA